jgi:hypothetical protein
MHTPFVGICDFTNQQQVSAMREVLVQSCSIHHLGVGAMMSYKTLRGMDTKWAAIFPPKESLNEIFVRQDRVLNILHYADYDGASKFDEWVEALMLAPEADALQLDMVWPDRRDFADFRQTYMGSPDRVKMILQVSRPAVERLGNDPKRVALELKRYHDEGFLEYALFDMSGGNGMPMDALELLTYIREAVDLMPDLSIVVAGGLGPSTCNLIEPIAFEVPFLSTDAQAGLRPSRDATQPIDWGMAAHYTRCVAEILDESACKALP